MSTYKSIQLPLSVNNDKNGLMYREYTPSKVLQDYVACYWILKSNETQSLELLNMKIVPDGCINIVFSNDNNLKGNGILIGINKEYYTLTAKSGKFYFGVRLLPGISPLIFSYPTHLLMGKIIPLNEIAKLPILKLTSNIINSETDEEKINIIEEYAKKLLDENKNYKLDPIIYSSLNNIYKSKGQISVKELVNLSDTSAKSLFRKYNSWVGMSPKLFCRIVRFQSALQDIVYSEKIDWPSIAFKNGYYDQAHFIKEFKEFFGQVPSFFFK